MTVSQDEQQPPRPERRPVEVELHGDVRVDEYAWLRGKDDPAVKAHLDAENRHLAARMGHTDELQKRLYDEMVGRIQETDQSVPYREGSWYYSYRTEEGKQYPIHCRRATPAGDDVVILDENALAKEGEYLNVGALAVSPDGRHLAYAVDRAGDERFEIVVKDLESGELLDDRVTDAAPEIAWASDAATIYYVTLDEASRPYKVFRHRLGDDPAGDALVHHEEDERFYVSVSRSRSGGVILIEAASHVTSEAMFIDASRPTDPPRMVAPRRQEVEYDAYHHAGDRFFILTNDEAVNFKLMEADAGAGPADWRELIPHDPAVFLTGVSVFRDHLVVFQRRGGVPAVRVRRLSSGEEHFIEFDEAVFTVGEGDNFEFDSQVLRFEYSSLVTPRSIFDYDMDARERTLLKQTPVLGGFDPSRYVCERIVAAAGDGAEVPISLVRSKTTAVDGDAPLVLVGYGSYGITYHPGFASFRLSLLDRGVIYAMAHIRGGSMMGRPWYEDGKLDRKTNTFTDFIACAKRLIDAGYTSASRLAITGGSAGGLLMGAVLNARPDLFRCAVADVPFVDSLNTMLDETLPLTVIEYEEWGNPNEPDVYRRMKAYAPYENVGPKAYPAILATAGLNDPRVGYWEAAKWVARLRDHTTSDEPILLKVHMGAGHQGLSGRYDAIKERALVYAFILDQLGATEITR